MTAVTPSPKGPLSRPAEGVERGYGLIVLPAGGKPRRLAEFDAARDKRLVSRAAALPGESPCALLRDLPGAA